MNLDLLRKYIEGNVTDEEAGQVVDWLDADEEHINEFMALHKVFNISVLNQVPIQKKEKFPKNISLRRIIKEVIKIAAVILLVLGGKSILENRSGEVEIPLYQTLYVPAGQRAELILPDSTKVWLNAQSRLVYPVTFLKENRSVELEGEGYFEVKRNEAVPFIVKTPTASVKVLGTEFNVSDYPNDIDFNVALLKGSVELWTPQFSKAYRMKAGEQVVFKDGKYTSSEITDEDYFKWKEGLLCFYNQPIPKIIDKLSLYFGVKINMNKPTLKNEYYTGKFRVSDGIEQVLKVLQLEHRFVYVKDNDLNEITIK